MINNLHHFEILTNSSKKLLDYFIHGYNFNLTATKNTDVFTQYLINSNSINFLITTLHSNPKTKKIEKTFSPYAYNTSLHTIKNKDARLFNLILSKKDTVFNAAFQVKDLDRILTNCRKHNVNVLRDKHILFDKNYSKDGFVECAVIESCVDGVTHSLFNTENYKGKFLPGFYCPDNVTENNRSNSELTYFDHLTYATFEKTSNSLIDWYAKVFNMKRFAIGREESNNGLIVKTGQSGMNLKVINYWLCAETGVEFEAKNGLMDKSFKFVISEPLPEIVIAENKVEKKNVKKNQISIFLEENNGPGIQHIGLFTNDIVKSVHESKKKNLDIKYYATPGQYYTMADKVDEIKKCGLDVNLLKDNHILLDSEIFENTSDLSEEDKTEIKDYLLQVFTQPIFDRNTVFLELIQRVGNARGFGAGNIKALWNAVQLELDKLENTKC